MNQLARELLAWISARPRTYAETMEAWRSTCPRHSTWEDACIAGHVEVIGNGGTMDESAVVLTELGRTVLTG